MLFCILRHCFIYTVQCIPYTAYCIALLQYNTHANISLPPYFLHSLPHDYTFSLSPKLPLIPSSTSITSQVFWHSSAHVLGAAIEAMYGAHLTIGPPLQVPILALSPCTLLFFAPYYLSSYPIISCLALSPNPALSSLLLFIILQVPLSSCNLLSSLFLADTILSYPIRYSFVLSYHILSHPTLSYSILFCPLVSYSFSSYPILPIIILSYLFLQFLIY